MDGTAFLPEFDQEMATTRRTLERVPDDRFAFKPHEKSYSLRELAGHIANIPVWTGITMDTTELDVDGPFEQFEPQSTEEILAYFDDAVKDARARLEAASAEELMVPWSLVQGGEVTLTLPRVVVIRSFVLNHTIHHRAQLGVYLRLLDVPVPATYGPSADEAN